MLKILAVLCIWKVTSRPLIWPLFEPNIVDMKWRYGIFKLFSIFFNFLLACVSQAVSFESLDKIQFSNAHFFRFVLRISRVKKNLGLLAFFGLFGPFSLFSLFFFFLIVDFFYFSNIWRCQKFNLYHAFERLLQDL